jgi:hypothetical protein
MVDHIYDHPERLEPHLVPYHPMLGRGAPGPQAGERTGGCAGAGAGESVNFAPVRKAVPDGCLPGKITISKAALQEAHPDPVN